jgi:serine/threonine-protein kinase HipA
VDVHGRHFVETGKAAGLGPAVIRQVLDEVTAEAATATDRARSAMPADFHDEVHRSIEAILPRRLRQLESAWAEL